MKTIHSIVAEAAPSMAKLENAALLIMHAGDNVQRICWLQNVKCCKWFIFFKSKVSTRQVLKCQICEAKVFTMPVLQQ